MDKFSIVWYVARFPHMPGFSYVDLITKGHSEYALVSKYCKAWVLRGCGWYLFCC